MTKDKPNYREKGRAVFLAAIMVLSVVAMSASLVGVGAASAQSFSPVGADDINLDEGDEQTQDVTFEVQLDGNDNEDITLDFSEGEAEDGANLDFTGVEAIEDGDFTADPAEGDFDAGEQEVTFNLENTDEESVTDEVTVTLDVDTEEASPDTPNHEVTAEQAGSDIQIDYNVFESADAFLEVSDLSAQAVAESGETIEVSANIENTGGDDVEDASVQYHLDDNGIGFEDPFAGDDAAVSLEQEVTLDSGADEDVTFTVDIPADDEAFNGDYPLIEDEGGPAEHGVFTADSGQTADLAIYDSDDRGFIEGDVRDTDLNEISNVEDVVIEITRSDTEEDPVRVLSPDEDGEFITDVPATPDGVDYDIEAELEGFESFERQDLTVQSGDSQTANIRLERIISPDDITVTPEESSGLVGDEFDLEAFVTTDDEVDEEGDPILEQPFEGATIETEVLNEDFDDVIEVESDAEETDEDGLQDFVVSVDEEALDDDVLVVESDIEFEVQEGDEVVDTVNVEFRQVIPDGDSTIFGEVESTDIDTEGVNAHAILADELANNEITVDLTDLEAEDDEQDLRLVEINEDTENDILNPQAEYLWNNADDEQINVEEVDFGEAGEGLTVTAQENVTNEDALELVVLAPGDYAVQLADEEGEFEDADDLEATEEQNDADLEADDMLDLTWTGIEDRTVNEDATDAILVDETDEDGQFVFENVFTDLQQGEEYAVVVGDEQSAITTEYNVETFDDDAYFLQSAFEVSEVDVDADAIDITNVGTLDDASEIEDFEENLDEFEDQSDEERQDIPRDGETIDVIDVSTFVEDDDFELGAEASVSVEDIEGFDGEFVTAADVADYEISEEGDEITIDTEDGSATVFLQMDGPINEDIEATIEADLIDEPAEDSTDKLFSGVISADYETGQLSGIVTDDDNNPVVATVYADTFNAEGLTFDVEPAEEGDLEGEWEVSLYDGDDIEEDALVQTVTVDREDVENFDFSAFDEDISVDQNVELVTETGGDASYTLSPVVADDGDGAGTTVTGVSEGGETGTASAAVFPGATATANVVIPDASPAQFTVSDLEPEDATVDQGDLIDVSATVTNVGDVTASTDVELRLDDNVVDSTTTDELEAGEDETVVFENVDTDELEGEFEHGVFVVDDDGEVIDSQTGTLTVEEANENDGDNSSDLSEYNTADDGTVDASGLDAAFADWQAGDLGADDLDEVFSAWQAGASV